MDTIIKSPQDSAVEITELMKPMNSNFRRTEFLLSSQMGLFLTQKGCSVTFVSSPNS